MAVWPVSFAITQSLSDDPPVPLSARFVTATDRWSVTFDQVLESGALNAANWSFNIEGSLFGASNATASGKSVSGDSSDTGPGFGGPDANYAPPPSDVIGLNGVAAAAFSGFPVTVD